jgi:hypothetical protein
MMPSLPNVAAGYSCPIHQEPQVVFANGPLTPPLSPKPEQSIASISPQELCSDINHQCIHVRDIVSATSDLMDDKETVDEDADMNPSSHPRRVLEDEAVRFTRSGLKLADFEVRGTLGARVQSLSLRPTF